MAAGVHESSTGINERGKVIGVNFPPAPRHGSHATRPHVNPNRSHCDDRENKILRRNTGRKEQREWEFEVGG